MQMPPDNVSSYLAVSARSGMSTGQRPHRRLGVSNSAHCSWLSRGAPIQDAAPTLPSSNGLIHATGSPVMARMTRGIRRETAKRHSTRSSLKVPSQTGRHACGPRAVGRVRSAFHLAGPVPAPSLCPSLWIPSHYQMKKWVGESFLGILSFQGLRLHRRVRGSSGTHDRHWSSPGRRS
jgi:hypothetical protein